MLNLVIHLLPQSQYYDSINCQYNAIHCIHKMRTEPLVLKYRWGYMIKVSRTSSTDLGRQSGRSELTRDVKVYKMQVATQGLVPVSPTYQGLSP